MAVIVENVLANLRRIPASILIVTAYNIFQFLSALMTTFDDDFRTFLMSLVLGIVVLTINVFLITKHRAAFYLMLLWYAVQSGSIVSPSVSFQFSYGLFPTFGLRIGSVMFGFNPLAILMVFILFSSKMQYSQASGETEFPSDSGGADMQNSRSAHPILYIIAALLLVNVGLTVWMLASETRQPAQMVSGQRPLPASLTSTERQQLFETFREKYNANDFDGVYELFSDATKIQVSKQGNRDVLQKLQGMFGDIELGGYSHYQYKGTPGGPDIFELYYTVRYSAEKRTGYLRVAVLVSGEDYGVIGYNMGLE